MTTPTQQILAKIKELGDDQAAKYFGKKKTTVQMWRRTEQVPLNAYETFLKNEGGKDPIAYEAALQPPMDVSELRDTNGLPVSGRQFVAPSTEPSIPPAAIHERFLALEYAVHEGHGPRIDALESALLQRVAAPPSMVRPLETVSTTNAQPVIRGAGPTIAPSVQPGVASGIAPTREQSEDGVGLPAQPAPHMKIAPTDPGATMGWNRPLAPRGNGGAVRAGH